MGLRLKISGLLLTAISWLNMSTASGQACLNTGTLQAFQNGNMSDVQMFVAVNECMDNCVRQALQGVPSPTDFYVVAVPKVQQMKCVIDACSSEANLLLILPMVKGAMDRATAQKFMASVMTASQSNGCGQQQLDPVWYQLLLGGF